MEVDPMRAAFVSYLAVIVSGLVFFVVIGVLHR
jgi:hypothetical protein